MSASPSVMPISSLSALRLLITIPIMHMCWIGQQTSQPRKPLLKNSPRTPCLCRGTDCDASHVYSLTQTLNGTRQTPPRRGVRLVGRGGLRHRPGSHRHRRPDPPAIWTDEFAALSAEARLRANQIDAAIGVLGEFWQQVVRASQRGDRAVLWLYLSENRRTRSGSERLADAGSAVLRLPSVIVPTEGNYLLNPAHPDFARITIGPKQQIRFDPGLIKPVTS